MLQNALKCVIIYTTTKGRALKRKEVKIMKTYEMILRNANGEIAKCEYPTEEAARKMFETMKSIAEVEIELVAINPIEHEIVKLDARQERAIKNIECACNTLLGELEIDLCDFEEDDERYIASDKLLNNHEALVNELYEMATTAIYRNGMISYNKDRIQKELRDINFCGKEWLMKQCDAALKKEHR